MRRWFAAGRCYNGGQVEVHRGDDLAGRKVLAPQLLATQAPHRLRATGGTRPCGRSSKAQRWCSKCVLHVESHSPYQATTLTMSSPMTMVSAASMVELTLVMR